MPPEDALHQRILVAEDDPAILELVTTRLEIAGYVVSRAHDGVQALEALYDFRPTLAILDVNMPRLDGFGVLRAMRMLVESQKTPVLMLTARHSSADVAAARALGANDYLVKPFDDRMLLARVARLLQPNRPAPQPPKVEPSPAPDPSRIVFID